MNPSLIFPDWPASLSVRAAVTTRAGGVSQGRYASFNLGEHVGDDPPAVAANRARLRAALGLKQEPAWLRQVHGTRVVRLPVDEAQPEADAAWTDTPGVICAVLAADCLPVLLCARDGRAVAAIHAGWRGLAAGVIEQTIAALPVAPAQLLAWLGPAIGPASFEVGAEVRAAFLAPDPDCGACFEQSRASKWLADLYALAGRRLRRAGVRRVSGGGFCTHADAGRFYSHRREGVTGRMATLIWIEQREAASAKR